MGYGKINKRDFVDAYRWAYATSKKEAEYIWKISTYEYKVAIIESFISNCKKSFYE